ncbi:ATP-binding protein [Methanolobus bombayensis]|uniref:ATP-binding protein n=1 Tax=Methanolobus bombayensis TaxID=38023 RepID=UPI001AE66059|nr:ATP-binding protein [Methanolobus bombayensis]MBP1908317.1 adenylate kinase [Methanolobus bombayensis]
MPGNTKTDLPHRRFCFTGVRGVGKSTVINRIRSSVPDIKFISGSDLLYEMMGENYKHFEYLPEAEKYALRIKLNSLLQAIQKDTSKDLVVDSHLTVFNLKTHAIDTIFTEKDFDFYTDIILLDSYPERILDHRQRDTEKERITNLDVICKELDFERQKAAEISNKYGIRLHVVEIGVDTTEKLKNVLQ